MRYAPLIVLGLVSVSCGRGAPADGTPVARQDAPPGRVARPHDLVGAWALRRDPPSGLRLELRVDSVVRDSIWGHLTFFMAGDAGFLRPEDWDPLGGTVAGGAIRMAIEGRGRAPSILLDGTLTADTVRLRLAAFGVDTLPGPWRLVRPTVSRP